jgi:tripartite-type tricarboxylate transporter receptor subunit TctC
MLKIDTHAHWYRPESVKLIAREGAANGAEVGRSESGRVTMQAPGIRLRPIFSAPYVDLTLRLKLMLALLLKNAAAYATRRQPARPVRALCWSMWMLAALVVQPSFAQREAPAAKDYPTRVIRIVVPYGAGAGPDVVGRTIAEKMAASLGHNIVLDNRGGGGGVLGTALVAKAAPDGYTLLLNVAAYATYPYFFKNLAYDPWKDLIPVTLMARNVGYVLVVNPSLPARSVRDLVALAKANPRKLNYADAGLGSVSQMAAELFAYTSNIKLTPVHYTGVPAMLTDIISGQVEMGFPAAPSALPFMGAGRLRVLGITADKRWKKMPDVPTLAEAGVKGYKYDGWYGLWFPAGTPAAYVNRIQSEVVKALNDPGVKQRLDDQGLEGVGSTPQEFAKVIEDEFALNKKLTASMGIAPQ